jgi:hypothetical protein
MFPLVLILRILAFWDVCCVAGLTEPTISKTLFSFETSGSVKPATQLNITEEQNSLSGNMFAM